jgi:hypothetical protein
VGTAVPTGLELVALDDEFQHADHPGMSAVNRGYFGFSVAPSEYRQVSTLTSKQIMAISGVRVC